MAPSGHSGAPLLEGPRRPARTRSEEKAAFTTSAAEEAASAQRQQTEQQTRLLQEKAKKKILWEEELQRELEYQRQQKATREAQRRSLGPQVGGSSMSAMVFPE